MISAVSPGERLKFTGLPIAPSFCGDIYPSKNCVELKSCINTTSPFLTPSAFMAFANLFAAVFNSVYVHFMLWAGSITAVLLPKRRTFLIKPLSHVNSLSNVFTNISVS